jgi:hypothetical protein
MTIPAKADYFLVQNVFGLATGLPEDVIVNTFIFKNQNQAGPLGGNAQERASNAVKAFFIDNAAAEGPFAGAIGNSIMGLMANNVSTWQQKVYDLGLPPGGRPPVVFDLTSQMVPRSQAAKYPSEVAIVLSLQTPIIGRRGKGRVYLGPWTTSVGSDVPGGVGVNESVRKRICAQASRLALGNGQDMEWAVWSTTRSQMARVVGGWVDDDFDTQRRRGLTSSFRTKWGTTVPTQAA